MNAEIRAKLREILSALLKELKSWENRRSDRRPVIIELHERVTESDPTAEKGVLNEGVIALALYTALTELDKSGDPCGALATLAYHFVTSHPFVDGNKRTTLGVLDHIFYSLGINTVPQPLEEELMRALAEVSDMPPELDEFAIDRLQQIICQTLRALEG